REWRALGVTVAVASVVAIAYSLPLWSVYGDPLINVHWYQQRDWQGRLAPLALPLLPLARGYAYAATAVPNTYVIKVGVWGLVVLAGSALLVVRSDGRRALGSHPVECAFGALSLLFLFCYDAPAWSWIEFPRFAIPAMPFVWLGLEPWLP